MMLKMSRRLAVAMATLSVLVAVVVAFLSTKHAPDFYRQLLATPRQESVRAGMLFERHVIELSNRMRRDSNWSARLTEDQVNGWLAADLPEKFPEALPGTIQQPRVSIVDGTITVVFKVESMRFSGVVQVSGELFSTNESNQVAFRIIRVRSGFLPVPVAWWSDRLEASLRKNDIVLEWSEWEGDPVALINLPTSLTSNGERKTILDSVQLGDKSIELAGRTIHHSTQVVSEPADSIDRIQF